LASLLFTLIGIPNAYSQDTAYLSELLDLAGRQRLHEDPYWRILMHYKKGLRGYTSLIDDPAFFLAPDGKTNPEAELCATLKAFFAQHCDQALAGEHGLLQVVAGAVQADHQAIADQQVVTDTFDINDILDAPSR
jgi:hypothetical protein